MKKAWVYSRRNIKGWWVGWYEGGKKRAKALPSKALAKHFCQLKYTQLNSDVFTGIVNADWHQMVEEYRKAKQVEGLRETSIYESVLRACKELTYTISVSDELHSSTHHERHPV